MTSRVTKVPSIPEVRDDNVREVLQAIKDTLLVREGSIGNPLDQVATLRDLVSLNLAEEASGEAPTTVIGGGGTIPVIPTLPPPTIGYNPGTDFTVPPAPTGLRASGGFSNVFLAWDGAPYRNHAYAEVWRANEDNLGSAVLIGTTAANVYADPAQPDTTYYYWIRFVSAAAVTGAYNATSGTPATTAIDVDAAFRAVTEEIERSQLFASLSSRIDQVSVQSSLSASQVAVLQEARAIFEAQLSQNSSAALGLLRITDDQATRISLLGTRVGDAESSISTLETTTANQALSISTLTTTVGGNTTSIQTLQNTTDGLSGQYTVKIDNNGHVSGFGLASSSIDGTPTSEFIVRADRFAFVNPSAYRLSVFSLTTTPGSVASISTLQNQSTVTITTTLAHGYVPGNVITIAGVTSDTRWNTTYTVVAVPTTTSFTVLATNRLFTGFTGTITARRALETIFSVSSIVPGEIFAVCSTLSAHNLSFGQGVTIAGVTSDIQWNKDWVVSEVVNTSQFKFPISINLPSPATGTMTSTPWGMASLITSANHGLSGGDRFSLIGVGSGALGWNKSWQVFTVQNATTIQFRYPSYLPSSPTITGAKIGTSAIPFIIDGEKTYIQTALIKDATITSAKIQDLVADKITTGNLTAAVGVTTGRISGGVNPAFSFGSTNFGTGFYLGNDGGVYKLYVGSPDQNMNWNGTTLSVKGTVDALAGSIGGVLISNQGLQSTNYVAGSAGWRIAADGTFEASSGTFRGSITGATGTFSGSITGASGTFSGSLSSTSGTIGGLQIASTYLQSSNYVAGGNGFRINSNGTAEFGQVTVRGNITANALTANTVTTSNIVGVAVVEHYAAISSTSATQVQVTISVPSGASGVTVICYAGNTYNSGTSKDPVIQSPVGTLYLNDVFQSTQSGTVTYAYVAPAAGTYTLRVNRDYISGAMILQVIVYKR